MYEAYFFDDVGISGTPRISAWVYERFNLCIRVHIFGVPGWTMGESSNAVIDDYGDLVRVD
jgi:hypothetical protein